MVEGWHNGFQSLVGTTNPTLWTFLSALKKEENLDLQEESGLEDEKSSRTTEEEVERPQQPFKTLSLKTSTSTLKPLDYLFCLGELLSSV